LVGGHIPVVLNVPYANNNPVQIVFQRDSGTNDFFGLNVTAVNNTGRTWRGFDFIIVDSDNDPKPALSDHPANAHFHTGATAAFDEFERFAVVPPPSPAFPSALKQIAFTSGDNSFGYAESGETFVANGGANTSTGFRMHQFSGAAGVTSPNSFILTFAPDVLGPDRFEDNNAFGTATSL
jgi:hypothetical protein